MAEIKNKFKLVSIICLGMFTSLLVQADDETNSGTAAGSDDEAKKSAKAVQRPRETS